MNLLPNTPVLVRRSKDGRSFIRKTAPNAGRIFLSVDAPRLTTSRTRE